MPTSVLLFLSLAAGPMPSDTTWVVAEVERDLTGNGRAEQLILTASDSTADSVRLTFEIRSAESPLYADTFDVTRTVTEYDGRQRRLTDDEWAERIAWYGEYFFAANRFRPMGVAERFAREADFRYGDPQWMGPWRALHGARQPTERESDRFRRLWEDAIDSDIETFRYSNLRVPAIELVWLAELGIFYDMHR